VLLGLGVAFAVEGPVNTFMRAGKLFPGPHLYAGAGCITLWALAAALVPQMQKGKVKLKPTLLKERERNIRRRKRGRISCE